MRDSSFLRENKWYNYCVLYNGPSIIHKLSIKSYLLLLTSLINELKFLFLRSVLRRPLFFYPSPLLLFLIFLPFFPYSFLFLFPSFSLNLPSTFFPSLPVRKLRPCLPYLSGKDYELRFTSICETFLRSCLVKLSWDFRSLFFRLTDPVVLNFFL